MVHDSCEKRVSGRRGLAQVRTREDCCLRWEVARRASVAVAVGLAGDEELDSVPGSFDLLANVVFEGKWRGYGSVRSGPSQSLPVRV